MARKHTDNKGKSGNKGKKNNHQLTAAEIKTYIENNLYQQRQAYEEGLAGANGEAPEAVPAEIDIDTWLEAEHLDGTIRNLVSEREHLSDSVGICPVYNADAVEQASTNAALNKVLASTTLKTKLNHNGDRILDRPALPEPRVQFNAELNKLKKLDQESKDALKEAFEEYNNDAEELNRNLLESEDLDDTPFKENESLAEKITEIEAQIDSLKITRLTKTNLKKALNQAVDAVEDKLRRVNEYNQQDMAFNLEAQKLLADHNFSEDTLFKHYLDAVVDSDHHFLGNLQNRELSFYDDACNQLIIPFRKNGSHYTVAVAHMYMEDKKQIAKVKYYDSMGSDLDESLQAQLVAFFEGKGFEVEYECVSEHEQKEGYNCSIFASHKAIDMVNENEGNDERLLEDLNEDNYDQLLNYYRYVVTLKLSEMGQNVSAGKELTKDLRRRQREFVKLSKDEAQLNDLKALLKDIGNGLEKALNKVKGEKASKKSSSNKSDPQPLPLQNPNNLFNRCDELCKQMHTLLEQKQALATKSKKDNEDIQSLIAAIQSFKAVRDDIQKDLKRFQSKVSGSPALVSDIQSWVKQLNWKKVLGYGVLGGIGLFIGLPYALAFFITYSPVNPLVSILCGAGVFALGAMTINTIGNYLAEEQKKKEENTKSLASDEDDLSEEQEDSELDSEPEDDNEEQVDKRKKKTADNVIDLDEVRSARRNLLPQFDKAARDDEKKQNEREKKKINEEPEKGKPKNKKR
ncbi:MAG: hypothetical protein BGO43_11835 [Gammaproteobacteria bacterium 39-13]|nr:hypothetical protein [Gammaproteobacteria bacterium]OJV85309.1 MAG: hypothetical protein BGO43_11835 [Gammaproteobacteria bacterium 39-13]